VKRITLTRAQRAELFFETANRRGLSPVVAEKDYWVCAALTALFSAPQPIELIFKGGTSLSKCYSLIERFSEDVDLAFDRAGLGFIDERDPEGSGLSNNKRRALIEELSEAAVDYVAGAFRDDTVGRLTALLPDEPWSLTVASDDSQTLLFAYPPSFEQETYGTADYIHPVVRLELGARSDQTPSELLMATAFATEEFGPELSHLDTIQVPSLAAGRTFWEKATLLHAENYRDQPFFPARSRSRHLYDLVQLTESDHGQAAMADMALRDRVVQHKTLFFASAQARYDLFAPPSIQLLPKDREALARLRSDYVDMAVMFFGDPPPFESLVDKLQKLEERLNTALHPSAS